MIRVLTAKRPKGSAVSAFGVVLPARLGGPPDRRVGEDLVIRLERGRNHPEDRRQEDHRRHSQQGIMRDFLPAARRQDRRFQRCCVLDGFHLRLSDVFIRLPQSSAAFAQVKHPEALAAHHQQGEDQDDRRTAPRPGRRHSPCANTQRPGGRYTAPGTGSNPAARRWWPRRRW